MADGRRRGKGKRVGGTTRSVLNVIFWCVFGGGGLFGSFSVPETTHFHQVGPKGGPWDARAPKPLISEAKIAVSSNFWPYGASRGALGARAPKRQFLKQKWLFRVIFGLLAFWDLQGALGRQGAKTVNF